VLDEASRRDEDVVLVRDLDDLPQRRPWHQRERAARELQRVDVLAHRVKDVAHVARSHHRVVGAADLGYATAAPFGVPVAGAQ